MGAEEEKKEPEKDGGSGHAEDWARTVTMTATACGRRLGANRNHGTITTEEMTNPCPLHPRVVSLVFGLRPLGGSSDLAQLIASSNGTPSAALKSSCAAPEQPATC